VTNGSSETERELELLVTGVSSDTGGAIADEIVRTANRRALLVSRSCVARKYSQSPGSIRYYSGFDLTRPEDLRRLVGIAGEFFSGPFAVIHCVGDFWRHKPLVDTKLSEIRQMFESHYFTLCGLSRALIPLMIRNGGGHIVGFSCNSVLHNYPDMAPFTAAKAAVESLLKCISNEYSQFGISTTALALPTIRTPKVIAEKKLVNPDEYISPEELASTILRVICKFPVHISGNAVQVFKHNARFYNSGYFERNPRRKPLSGESTPEF
jgi:NAD(P)-dependent dehydrogenase (short-subunit alcohol dehydrogenase family)